MHLVTSRLTSKDVLTPLTSHVDPWPAGREHAPQSTHLTLPSVTELTPR